eukprot:CAMPEP_0198324978 /NCGR_PEP_ID=MMETSP1450-20131203/12851_1 /TAXON_ID=753684 ORGANISM="Madagascaria erythrocladiodes, Strain CCMP3234" /NCGR_SAMPLE_ID=MMETSP1450 /ASSEMBLY_ACC=CAM_ASM_001115 /LENGTH=335 /DNA_ID=CAMNT_0044028819 /DNA_START=72 /DNA_END=1079 /DNA_ORIENTATION=+
MANGSAKSRPQMMAAVRYRYGTPDVMEVRAIDRPAVKENDILIRVHSASVNKGDWHLLTGKPYLVRAMGYGMFKPKNGVIGQDVAGTVEQVGSKVTDFKPGDHVFGEIGCSFAEYASVTADKIAIKPENVSFEQAAATPCAALTALQSIRDVAKVKEGQKVLVNGASGGVGTFCVQIAKLYGAHVTAVCSGKNADLVKELGADEVIDYTKEDFTAEGAKYDVILDMIGNYPLSSIRNSLTKKGMFLSIGSQMGDWFGPIGYLFRLMLASMNGPQKFQGKMPVESKKDLLDLQAMLAEGKIVAPIQKEVPLSEISKALSDQGQGHVRGKTVIKLPA